MFLTRIVFFLCGKSVYQDFSDRLPLQGTEKVLDFGCGMGTVAYYVARRLPQGHLVCLDISQRRLSACRRTLRRFRNVSFLCVEASELPRDSFDVIYCHFVLHDIPPGDLETVIPWLAESLKPGGVFVIREPLNEAEALRGIKRLTEHSGLLLKTSRITHVPLMGNAVESIFAKNTAREV
jgi:ubiquinone/menaquinone biosynthesis C-methylase UbiE